MLLETRDPTVGEEKCKCGIGEASKSPAVLEFIDR